MEHYDIWKETTHFFEDDRFKAFTPEEQQQMKESHLSCIEQICPKGMNLAMLEYEEENDVQLNFYTKEFLDKRPVHSNSASSVGMIFGSDRKFGINGFRSRLCMIKPIEKDFQGSIDAELFSCYIRIPEEIIKV
ncbi:hypothetical protein SDC9_187847 [bioreactor metagenome]|uniref:Uncharacterized protein n=1 Tax=bioreactor metagenome TaxID=1076179 RepID=A0A645HMM8_9ZZZZ